MDPALLKERELFKKRALAQPSVEKRKASKPIEEKKVKKSRPLPKPRSTEEESYNYKTAQGSSQFKFGVLTKIVRFMKTRHQKGESHALDIDEILDETSQLDVGMQMKHWLTTEALNNNPKIIAVDNGTKYLFKPKFPIRDRKSLLKMLDKYDQRGLGGILLDDVEESLPRCDKVIKMLGDQIVQVPRGVDKKTVLFYNDKSLAFTVDEELQKLWRSVPVDGIDEQKIDDYLDKQGISSMQDISGKKVTPAQKRKTKRSGGKRKPAANKHNDHLGDLLKDYSELTEKK